MYPRGQRHTAVSPPVVKHFPPWEHGTLLHLSAVHSSETTINQTDQWSTRSALSTWMIRQMYGITYTEKSFDKIDVDASACIIIRAIEKYLGVEGGFWLRVPVDSIVGVNIWRKYGGSPFLLSSFRAYRRRWGAGNRWDVCEIIFRRARSTTLSEISDEWKRLFFFRLFSPSLFFSSSFVFFSLSGDLGLGREEFRKIDRRYVCRFLDRRNIDVVILIVDAFVALLFPRVEWRNLDMNK